MILTIWLGQKTSQTQLHILILARWLNKHRRVGHNDPRKLDGTRILEKQIGRTDPRKVIEHKSVDWTK